MEVRKLKEQTAFSAEDVEKILVIYLGEHQTSKKIFQLLINSGVFDLLADGLTRLALEDIQDDMQVEFLRNHMLLKNWTAEQVGEIDEELAGLGKETETLQEEQKALDAEWENYLTPLPETPVPLGLPVTPSKIQVGKNAT
ncbi:hypothetical protein RvY_11250 [Ramazzottius varieornatus]|uniref:Uncharacterized protein n=1 Tax=Ramazzottius varieornatus TaxID=947166 RepID=A0A1D1VFH7_RAMVA|nr:hypothetical protein RvY_11250 [Ramazzottius varieornatus]